MTAATWPTLGIASCLFLLAVISKRHVHSNSNDNNNQQQKQQQQPKKVDSDVSVTVNGPMRAIYSLADLSLATSLSCTYVCALDLSSASSLLLDKNLAVDGAVFMGCEMDPGVIASLSMRGAACFPAFAKQLPYKPYRVGLYSVDELYKNFDPANPTETYRTCPDYLIYNHWLNSSKDSLLESLAQYLHDFSITQALDAFLKANKDKFIVAIMGMFFNNCPKVFGITNTNVNIFFAFINRWS